MSRDSSNDASRDSAGDSPLVVRIIIEIVTYTVYFAWLSLIAAGALYLDIPPLPAIQDTVAGPWQGTAAAIASGALALAVMRLVYDAIRARVSGSPQPEPDAAPRPEARKPIMSTKTARKRKNKKGRRSRKR